MSIKNLPLSLNQESTLFAMGAKVGLTVRIVQHRKGAHGQRYQFFDDGDSLGWADGRAVCGLEVRELVERVPGTFHYTSKWAPWPQPGAEYRITAAGRRKLRD